RARDEHGVALLPGYVLGAVHSHRAAVPAYRDIGYVDDVQQPFLLTVTGLRFQNGGALELDDPITWNLERSDDASARGELDDTVAVESFLNRGRVVHSATSRLATKQGSYK